MSETNRENNHKGQNPNAPQRMHSKHRISEFIRVIQGNNTPANSGQKSAPNSLRSEILSSCFLCNLHKASSEESNLYVLFVIRICSDFSTTHHTVLQECQASIVYFKATSFRVTADELSRKSLPRHHGYKVNYSIPLVHQICSDCVVFISVQICIYIAVCSNFV